MDRYVEYYLFYLALCTSTLSPKFASYTSRDTNRNELTTEFRTLTTRIQKMPISASTLLRRSKPLDRNICYIYVVL